MHRNGTLFNQTQDDPTEILSIKGESDPVVGDTSDQSHVVLKTTMNAIPNEMEKQMERLETFIRLENNKMKQELKEMRDEMKHHRKWY